MQKMIKVNLSRLMGENKINFSSLSNHTGISEKTLSDLYHEKLKGIRFETLDKLCNYFNVPVGDLLEHQKVS